MLRFARTATISLAAVALGASGLLGAASAGAYPAGQDLELVIRTQNITAGKSISLGIRQGQPGCTISLRLRAVGSNQVLASSSVEAGPRGRARKSLKLPAAAGNYVVVARQGGGGCRAESDTVRFRAS